MIRRDFLSLSAYATTAAISTATLLDSSLSQAQEASAEPAAESVANQPTPPTRKRPVLNQFHRGGGNFKPDNTLETFLWAWGCGAIPEADARFTKDKVAVAFHDDNLQRISRGIPEEMRTRRIADLNWDEIRDIDIGSFRGEQYKTEKITTMEAVFACMKGRPERLLYIDEKGMPPELMASLSEQYGVQEQIIFASSNYDLLPRWKKLAPKAKAIHWMGAWTKGGVTDENCRQAAQQLGAKLDKLEEVGFADLDILQIHVITDLSKPDPFCPSSDFMRQSAERIKKNGVVFQSLSWTQGDKAETYYKLIDLGVQSFATDYPVEFMAAIAPLPVD